MQSLIKPIKGIFFDIGWTLNYPASGDWMVINKIFQYVDKDTLLSIPKARQENAFKKCMDFLSDNHLVFNEQQEYEQFKAFYTKLFSAFPEILITKAQIEQIAFDKIYNDDNYIFYNDVHDTIKQLSKKYKLGIISDTWPSAERILKNAGIYDYLSGITFSCNFGVYKPNSKMYEHAIKTMGIEANQTIFIDDSIDNLDGAKRLGIQPILITRKGKPDNYKNYICIEKLSDLLQLL